MPIENIVSAINNKLDRELKLFNTKLGKILTEVETQLMLKSIETFTDPLQFDFVVNQTLRDAGYFDLVNELIDKSYDKSYSDILKLFAESGLDIVFTPDDVETLINLKAIDLQTFTGLSSKAALELKANLYKYSISDLDIKTMTENIAENLKDTDLAKYSKTYAETSISNFNQAVIDLKAEGVTGEVYIYRGVSDSKTRKFCKCLINQGKYYTKSDAASIKNDKRRKWNCRHMIVPVSESYAKDRGYEEGSFTC